MDLAIHANYDGSGQAAYAVLLANGASVDANGKVDFYFVQERIYGLAAFFRVDAQQKKRLVFVLVEVTI